MSEYDSTPANPNVQEETSPFAPTPAQPHYTSRASQEAAGSGGHLYREVNRFAVLSLVAGILSVLTSLMWIAVFLPLAGLAFGLIARRQIDWAPGVMTGRGLAIAGITCSIVFGIMGVGIKVFSSREIPLGYTTLTFSELQPNKEEGELLPKGIFEQEGENVYIRGFMYPGKRTMGIQQFVLVPTQKHCQFCQLDLKSTDMIKVKLVGDLTTDYTTLEIGVGGRLRINRSEAGKPLGGWPYELEADYLYR
ncbi:MAG: DUF4190 domain-containing protein [Pirellulales bacterium]|nr:DUF4190 domain-containing protein [Pirellulales bacterium]